MRMKIVALAAGIVSLLAMPLAFAAFEPAKVGATAELDRATFSVLLADPYAEAPMQVALVRGFTTLDDML